VTARPVCELLWNLSVACLAPPMTFRLAETYWKAKPLFNPGVLLSVHAFLCVLRVFCSKQV
jgi:hypothetical protein